MSAWTSIGKMFRHPLAVAAVVAVAKELTRMIAQRRRLP